MGLDEKKIIITEKDAVKCRTLKLDNVYYLKIAVVLEASFLEALFQELMNRLKE